MQYAIVWNAVLAFMQGVGFRNLQIANSSNEKHSDCLDEETQALKSDYCQKVFGCDWNELWGLKGMLLGKIKSRTFQNPQKRIQYFKDLILLGVQVITTLASNMETVHKVKLQNFILFFSETVSGLEEFEKLLTEEEERAAERQAREAAERQAREAAERRAREAAERRAREAAERQAREAADYNVQFHTVAFNNALHQARDLQHTVLGREAFINADFYNTETQNAAAYQGLLLQTGVVDLDVNLRFHMEARERAHNYCNNLFLNPMFRQAAFDNYQHHYIASNQVLHHQQLIREAGIVPDPPTRPLAGVSTGCRGY